MDYVSTVGRRSRKRQQIHQHLLDCAGELFRAHGFDRTTIDDIAETADVARQTVFNHFQHKEALAVELAARDIERTVHCSHALLESGVPALEVLQRMAHSILDAAVEEGEVAVIMARELLHHNPERAAQAAERVPLARIFEAILEHARQEGAMRQDLPLDQVAARISSILRSIWLQANRQDPNVLRREIDICFDILFHGITDRRN